ncbi:hypothetical protein EV207_103166 [Scopulibacillus darangshiensis]|uniref:Antitoxin VbhA domain-containing protein n=1 Tax=Scopulibacillus darangshiensis TaxID=442528 RepID=A0A4R2P8S0_9BACL|nr:hypothetical protein [Scopulibacillus darangshiensis]TCP31282.1 hypothetical protein EV207_103166 [Scopulibacillus darangshiensis]
MSHKLSNHDSKSYIDNEKQINHYIQEAKATLAIEGLNLNNQAAKLIKEKLSGKLSEDDFLKRALELAKNG